MSTECGYDQLLSLVRAPSGFHSQPWEFVVIRDRTVKDEVAAAVSTGPPAPAMKDDADHSLPRRKPGFAGAPVFILLAGDWRARVQFPDKPQREREAQETAFFLSGLASAFLYLQLAAVSLGLSSQWVSNAAWGESGEAVRKILGLPEYIRTYDMMAVGYPAESPIEKKLRDVRDMIHYDACGPEDFRTPGRLEADTREFTEWCVRAH